MPLHSRPWWKELNAYHWFVLLFAAPPACADISSAGINFDATFHLLGLRVVSPRKVTPYARPSMGVTFLLDYLMLSFTPETKRKELPEARP